MNKFPSWLFAVPMALLKVQPIAAASSPALCAPPLRFLDCGAPADRCRNRVGWAAEICAART